MSDDRYFVGDSGTRYERGPLLAVQGKEGCESPLCRRMYERDDDGSIRFGPCMGYHCPYCGEPCSMMGHKACLAADQRELGA